MKCRNIQPFVLKAGDLIRHQPNYNGPNFKLKSIYYVAKYVWMMKYVTKKFLTHHMNSILVEALYAFNLSAGNIIRDGFSKIKVPPLIPHKLTKNTQSCAASIQVYSEPKSEEINNISRHVVSHIEVQVTSTDNTMTFLRSKGT